MKRRNIDNAKLRRTLKRNRMSEGFCSSSLIYLKILFVWAFVMMVDFLLDFRFEYFWPSWLLLRSIYDSFRYQGVAFSVFFVCVTVTSDMICFIFIPVQWLFFLAGTCVWVQYVWHADRGICLPTVTLWLLFIYVEASVRLKELKTLPFTLDICRPFAAHCIGYPVVTLGFGVKTYVSYRLRWRKQREVAKENEIYTQLLREALPLEQQHRVTDGTLDMDQKYLSGLSSADDALISNGGVARCPSSSALLNSAPYSFGDVANATSSISRADQSVAAALRRRRKFSALASSSAAIASAAQSSDGGVAASEHVAAALSSSNASSSIWWRLWTMTTRRWFFDADDNDDDRRGVGGASSWATLRWSRGDFDDGGVLSCAPYGSSMSWPPSATYDAAPSLLNGMRDSDDESGASKDSGDSLGGGVGVVANVASQVRASSRGKKFVVGANGKHRRTPASSTLTFFATTTTTTTMLASSISSFTTSSPAAAMTSSPTTMTSSSPLMATQQQQLLTKDLSSTNVNAQQQQQKVQDKEKDLYAQLESDLEKLRIELRSSRSKEQDLRRQLNDSINSEKSSKSEWQQLKQQYDQLQAKYQNLIKARQQDKENVSTLEKRVCEEQKLKNQFELMLKQEKKQQQKKLEEAVSSASSKTAALVAASNKSECTDLCKQRRRELDQQIKQARRDTQLRDEQLAQKDQEINALRQYKEANQVENLLSALNGLREKNQHLEASLSAETRIKLDLFSALGDARRQLEIITVQHARKEQELDDLRRRLNQLSASGCQSTASSLYNGAGASSAGPRLTPPPASSLSPSVVVQQAADQQPAYDVLSQQIYSAPYSMSSINGLMFDECGMSYPNMPFVPIVNASGQPISEQQQSNMSIRYSPSRSSSSK